MTRNALVVDSDFFFVEFLAGLLEKRGYQVCKAYDGKQGIASLENGPYAVLFADLVLPKVDGRQFFKVVRSKFEDRPFPIVALSGTLVEQMDDLDTIGADYFIAKGPIEKLGVHLNEFMAGLESQPGLPPAEKKILQTGGVFPRRDAMELLGSLEFYQAAVDCLGSGCSSSTGIRGSSMPMRRRCPSSTNHWWICSTAPSGTPSRRTGLQN